MFSPFLFFWGGGGMNESWLTNTLIGEMEDQLKNLWWTLFNLVLLWDVVGIPSVKVVGRWRSVADSRSFFLFRFFLVCCPSLRIELFLVCFQLLAPEPREMSEEVESRAEPWATASNNANRLEASNRISIRSVQRSRPHIKTQHWFHSIIAKPKNRPLRASVSFDGNVWFRSIRVNR